MPRILVITDPSQSSDGSPVLLEESVNSVHLSTDHAAQQLIERLAWAVGDAEVAERRGAMRAGSRSGRRGTRRKSDERARGGRAVRA